VRLIKQTLSLGAGGGRRGEIVVKITSKELSTSGLMKRFSQINTLSRLKNRTG